MSVLCLFKSHYSIGKSILTLEKPEPITETSTISIFSIAKENKLKKLILVDDSITGFLQAYTNANDLGIKLIFGLRFSVTSDVNDKSEGSISSESKIIIFARNKIGYNRLIKLSTFASKEGFYYHPRIDFATIKKFWSDEDLIMAIPFYDSFLHRNSFYFSLCVPDFSFCKPIFFIEESGLPFDKILAQKVESYCKDKFKINKARSVFYYKNSDFEAYLAFRCINKRTTLDKPEFEHMASDKFSFEEWEAQNAR